MIIGIAGRRGCGKDTLAGAISVLGFEKIDINGDIISPALINRGAEATRRNLIKFAMEMREKHHTGIWAEKASALIKRRPRKDYVVSGIRFPEEVDVFRKNFAGDFVLVSLVCGDRQRYERSMKRGTKGERDMSFDEYMRTEQKPTERVVAGTMKLSDYVLDNSGTLEELREETGRFLKTLKKRG